MGSRKPYVGSCIVALPPRLPTEYADISEDSFLTASVLSNLWNLPLVSVFQVPGVEFHAYQLGALGALIGARKAKQIRQNHLESRNVVVGPCSGGTSRECRNCGNSL